MTNNTFIQEGCSLSTIQQRFRKNTLHWYQIPRANNPSKPLQEKAVNILSTVVHKLRRTDIVILNHNYLSRITKAKQDQNVNLLKQLADLLDISFCAKVTIGKKIHRNSYVIKHAQKGRELLDNPQLLYQQNHFIGKKPIIPINVTSTEDKKEVRCAEFSRTSSIYKEEVLENRSIKKSNFVKKDLEEKKTKLTQIKKTIYQKPKHLSDFYPLSKSECQELQSSSGREFSLNAMNEILKNMSRRVKDRYFYSKKGFMAYMTKCFTFEMRDAVAVSNNNFRITANQTSEESRVEVQEQYLAEIENSLQVSPEWHLKKKLSSVLARETAYKLLKSYKGITIEENKARLQLIHQIELTSTEEEIIRSQIRATHEGVGGMYNFLEEIEITMPERAKLRENILLAPEITARVGIWGKVRETLSQLLGKEGEAIERNWISKLEAQIDESKQEIQLKAKSNLVKDYVEEKYLGMIRNIIQEQGFELMGKIS